MGELFEIAQLLYPSEQYWCMHSESVSHVSVPSIGVTPVGLTVQCCSNRWRVVICRTTILKLNRYKIDS